MGEEMQRASCGKGHRASVPLCGHHSPESSCVHQPERFLSPVLLSFYSGFITWAWLINSLCIGDWAHPPAPPRRLGVILEVPTLWSAGCFPWWPAPTLSLLRDFPEVTSFTWTLVWCKRACCEWQDMPFTLGLWGYLRNQGQKDQMLLVLGC